MERNRRRNYHSRLSSYEPRARCRTELTQTDSASSAVSLDTLTDVLRHCAAPFPLDDLTRWTEWQHNSYLNSLEASFVNEMRHSMHLRGSQSVQNNLNEVDKSRTSEKPRNTSGQFLVLQDGFWKKVSHEINEPMLESTGDVHDLAGSPLKFTSVERGCDMRDFSVHDGGLPFDEGHRRRKSIFSGRSSRSSVEQHDLCYPESAAPTAGITGDLRRLQNINHPLSQIRRYLISRTQRLPIKTSWMKIKGLLQAVCPHMDRRLNVAPADDASRHDHVVPINNFSSAELSSSNHLSTELLSELRQFPSTKI